METATTTVMEFFKQPETWRYVSLCLLAISVVLVSIRAPEIRVHDSKRIRDLAKRDLSTLGTTDYRFDYSIKNWIYSILVICYRTYNVDVMQTIREWAPVGIDKSVTVDIESPYTKFLQVIDDARREETTPVFKVSNDYDYHVLPKILKFNDYVNCKDLLIRIDETIGGAVNE